MKLPRRAISASGRRRCRAAGCLACYEGASLSVAAGAYRCWLRCWRRRGYRCARDRATISTAQKQRSQQRCAPAAPDRLAPAQYATRPAARQRPRPDAEIVGGEVSSRSSLFHRSSHSITSSARASSVGGTVRPSALAVLRLIDSSYLVGACTGKSAGFSPLRMRST